MGRKSPYWDDAPSAAVTDSDGVRLADPGALRREDRCSVMSGGSRVYQTSSSPPTARKSADGPAPRTASVPAPNPHHQHDPWLQIGPGGSVTLPPAGQPGHGRTAFLRRQPARIVEGRFEGGYTALFELICPGCGDHPYLDYPEIPPRLQWLRGPRTLEAALAVYDKHLGAASRPDWGTAPGT
jgi:hypothetical protein